MLFIELRCGHNKHTINILGVFLKCTFHNIDDVHEEVHDMDVYTRLITRLENAVHALYTMFRLHYVHVHDLHTLYVLQVVF